MTGGVWTPDPPPRRGVRSPVRAEQPLRALSPTNRSSTKHLPIVSVIKRLAISFTKGVVEFGDVGVRPHPGRWEHGIDNMGQHVHQRAAQMNAGRVESVLMEVPRAEDPEAPEAYASKRSATGISVEEAKLESEHGPGLDGPLEVDPNGRVLAALQSLPLRWQRVLWYADVLGEPPLSLGSLMGMKPAASSSLLRRARAALRIAYLEAQVPDAPEVDAESDGGPAHRGVRIGPVGG